MSKEKAHSKLKLYEAFKHDKDYSIHDDNTPFGTGFKKGGSQYQNPCNLFFIIFPFFLSLILLLKIIVKLKKL